jgi:hypothetical protein
MHENDEKLVQNFDGKREVKSQLIIPWSAKEDNIKIELKDNGRENENYIRLIKDRKWRRALVHTVMNVPVP